MQKAAAFEIIALNNLIAALSVKELKALVHCKKIKDNVAVPITRRIFWKGMRPYVPMKIKHLRHICQA